jgi:hypothetical protein
MNTPGIADLYRMIELLSLKQQRTVAEMLVDPDDEQARQAYRQTSAHIRALRMRVGALREVQHAHL